VLDKNDDLSRDNDWVANETAAAMRDLAGTVTSAPPLRLAAEASPAGARARAARARRWWSLFTPVLAAAAVVAVAVTLVIVRDAPDGDVVPAASSTATPPPVPVADGVPTYYVALHPTAKTAGAPNGLLVGDTVTGETVTTIAPPAGFSFASVSGAADVLAFSVFAVPAGASGAADRSYLLTITPGSSQPARLTLLPFEPPPGVVATALSASGTELAMATVDGAGGRRLYVYSVTTGRLLRSWSTTDSSAIASGPVPADRQPGPEYPELTWIDQDRAIAFPTLSGSSVSIRSVDVTGSGTDLMADSKVVANLGTSADLAGVCGTAFPLLSGNGTTYFCSLNLGKNGHTSPTTVRWVLKWQPRPTDLADDAEWRFGALDSELSVPAGATVYPAVLWSSSTGATLVVEWTVIAPGQAAQTVRFGTFSPGNNRPTITVLPAPPLSTAIDLPEIAW
jgi:hypothetical protein